jgi:FkbM family methyltransferase
MNKFKRTFGFIFSHPLATKHPLNSLTRFIIWQLQTIVSPQKLRVKNFVKPVKFYARKGLTGITGNIYAGLHEFNDMAFLLHLLNADDVFFDIGANVGSYTLLASGVRGAKTVALEPVASTYNILSENIALNKLQPLTTALNAGAGAAASTIRFTTDEDTTNHVLSADESADNTIEVPVVTVDSLLIHNHPTLIKIDVEGYETEVLKGMTNTLNSASLKALIIELNGSGGRYGYDESDIHALLLTHGFSPYAYDPFKRELKQMQRYGNHNTIYCRHLDVVTSRLKNAVGVKIMGQTI